MNRLICHAAVLAIVLAGGFIPAARAQYLDQIGVKLLRSQMTNVDGSGIRVAQPEAYNGDNGSTNSWEVNPANVGRPVTLFTYTSGLGTSTNYTNSVGTWSSHADAVANNFYGLPNGVATNVAHVDNFDANYFIQGFLIGGNYIFTLPATNINDPVVNQSFSYGSVVTNEQQAIDSTYDNYAAQYSTLFVSAANNGGPVSPPGTSYNCVCVGVYGGSSSIGPTIDNGRCKPDITAPGYPAGLTSFSTPYVSGAAAVLMQAALRGDGGSDTNSAFDLRTIKALLLNGAVKPADWTNSNSSPLDARYGAGVLNVFNSYEQLAGGKHGYVVTTSVASGSAHPPTGATGTVIVLNGWDFNTNSSGTSSDAVNHYYFNATNDLATAKFTATATLVWNRQQNQPNINDLDLFLYNCANSNLVACSTSLVDNVEHIFVPQLAPGRYDLQVWKAGGIPAINIVSAAEPYALAFAFTATKLNLAPAGANAVLTWPVYPAGFCVEATTNLAAPTWSTNSFSATLTGSTNILSAPMTNAAQFFRLRQPNF